MCLWRGRGADEAQPSGHPEMHDERAGLEPDEQVFRAPIDGNDTLAANGRFEFRSDGPAQAPIADDHVADTMSNERGCDAPPRGFYFGKLGQLSLKLFDLRFFVIHVLPHHAPQFLRPALAPFPHLILVALYS